MPSNDKSIDINSFSKKKKKKFYRYIFFDMTIDINMIEILLILFNNFLKIDVLACKYNTVN